MSTILHRMSLLAVTGCLAAGALACANRPMHSQQVSKDDLDHRLMLHTYIEEGRVAVLAVNTDATRRRGSAPLIPLGVVIGNNGRSKITVNRESLVLVDDTGKRYPLATVEEVRKLGGTPKTDLQVSARFAEVFQERLQAMTRVPSVFFPLQVAGTAQRGVVEDRVDLAGQHWMIDVIYFPHPEGELLNRKYELWFSPPELEDPVFVRFLVD